jgi:Ca-activated chloride channel family protein
MTFIGKSRFECDDLAKSMSSHAESVYLSSSSIHYRDSMIRLYIVFVFMCMYSIPHRISAQDIPFPRFIVNSDASDIDSLIPDSTHIQAHVNGVITECIIKQSFVYRGTTTIEASLLMPAHPSIMIHGGIVKVGNQSYKAEMQDKEKVREIYEQSKKKVDPFFLNWNESNAFQMHVSGIQPGMTVYYEIRYTQIMKPTEGKYTLTLPKPLKPYYLKILDVVPLYRDTFSDTSFAEMKEYPSGKFSSVIRVSKGGSMYACTANGFEVKESESEFICSLGKEYAGQTLSVSYQFADNAPRENLMLYEDNNDKFFLLTLHPPTTKRLRDSMHSHEYIILCDSSSLETGAAASFWKAFSKGLYSGDRINIQHFGNENIQLSDTSVYCTKEVLSRANVYVNRVQETEGLEPIALIDRLSNLLVQTQSEQMTPRTIIILSNGFVDASTDIFEQVSKQLQDANIFAIATGKESNERFFDAISRLTMAEPMSIEGSHSVMDAQAEQIAMTLQYPALTKLKVGFDGFNAIELEPASYPDLYSERPVMIFGKFKGKPKGRIVITGMMGDIPFAKTVEVSSIKQSSANTALPYLWAKQRIALLIDYNVYERTNQRITEITKLGKRYGVQTPYTAFGVTGSVIGKKLNPAIMYQPLNLSIGGTLVASSSGMQLARTNEVEVEAACNYQEAGAHDEEGLISVGSVMTEKVTDNAILESYKLSVEQQLSTMLACYAEALPKYFHLQGTVQMLVIYGEDGGVTEISLADSELNIPEVDACLLKAAQGINYPKTMEGMVQISFLLEVL